MSYITHEVYQSYHTYAISVISHTCYTHMSHVTHEPYTCESMSRMNYIYMSHVTHGPYIYESCKIWAMSHMSHVAYKSCHTWAMSHVEQARSTGWRRRIGCLFCTGHFPEKSPMTSGSFAERDNLMHPTPPCTINCVSLLAGMSIVAVIGEVRRIISHIVMSHMWMNHVTHKSYHTWVVSHTRHVTHESCHIWVMSKDESCLSNIFGVALQTS